MRTTVVGHTALADMMARLRAESAPSGEFRALIADVTTVLTVEAMSHMASSDVPVKTPVGMAPSVRVATPGPLVVPILRAGIGMLDAFLRLVPAADVGFLGLKRDEHTRMPALYMARLPEDLAGRHAVILDPMLATGGSMSFAIAEMIKRGADRITCLCVVAAPEGVVAVEHAAAGHNVELYLAALDDGLNADGYIVPGLGDAGDRLFGIIP